MRKRHTEQGHHAGPGAALEQAKKHSKDVDMASIPSQSNHGGHKSPANLEARKPVAGSDVGDDDLGWDKHEAVGDAEECEET